VVRSAYTHRISVKF